MTLNEAELKSSPALKHRSVVVVKISKCTGYVAIFYGKINF